MQVSRSLANFAIYMPKNPCFMRKYIYIITAATILSACGNKAASSASAAVSPEESVVDVPFDADSAYSYVARQVAFGPRVPNTEAHRLCGDWLTAELKRHGASVTEQKADIKAFDGTILHARNIFGQINPQAKERTLLLAHWDCRPWADADPDPANHKTPVDGANDGASGVGVILEIARQLNLSNSDRGVDFLFVDAEDWGTDGDDESWALGTKYFVENPPVENYMPKEAILLDMVGGHDATFYREYFSQQVAPEVATKVWSAATTLGYGDMFINRIGGAVMDDHVQLLNHGIPAIDIIEYHPGDASGFNPRWHTVADNMEGISAATLGAVGKTVLYTINR